MQRLRFSDVKSDCARVLNFNSTDSRLVSYVNEAQERLMEKGKWVGTYGRYRICLKESCITWPRQIATIEAVSVCDCPGTVRDEWFEFLGSGPGIVNQDSCIGNQLVDRGEFPAFDDVKGTGKKLAVYSSETEAATAFIILQYYDSNGQFVRTQSGGEWIDGEKIILPAKGAYAYSTFEVAANGLVRVIKSKTNGLVRLYEYEVSSTDLRPLGYYEPDEEVPVYRRSLVLGIQNGTGNGTCDTQSVEVAAKLRFIPAAKDNDFLFIQSRAALKLACKAIRHEENNVWDEAAESWRLAKEALEEQLNSYHGAGVVRPIRVQHRSSATGAIVAVQ